MNQESFFEYIFIFHCVTALFICIFIYIKNKKETANLVFSLYSFCVSIWSFGFFMLIQSEDLEKALFWRWFMDSGSVLLPALWLHFVYALIEMNEKGKKTMLVAYIISAILWLLNLSDLFGLNLFAASVDQKNLFAFYPTAGVGYWLFMLFYLAIVIYSLVKLLRYYLNCDITKFKRKQIKYVFFAAALGFFGGGMAFLLTFNINILPYGVILSAIYPIIIAYAITKYELLGIKFFATYFLIIALNIISFTHVFVSKNTSSSNLIEILSFVLVLTISYLLKTSFSREIKQSESLKQLSGHLKKAIDKLEFTNKKLKELDKAKNEFLSVAAHQLRTPTTAVKGYTAMILEGNFGSCDPEVITALKKVYQANERMSVLVEDLLNTSRIESGHLKYNFQKVDIRDILKELEATFVIKAKDAKIDFSVKYPKENLPEIIADEKKIREAVSNIIDNAIKYTIEGNVKVFLTQEDNFIKIVVKDTGRGMTERTISNLFKKFSRGEESSSDVEGTGLGLFVVKNLVEKHKGTILAESEGLGKGSKFTLKLPIERIESLEELNEEDSVREKREMDEIKGV